MYLLTLSANLVIETNSGSKLTVDNNTNDRTFNIDGDVTLSGSSTFQTSESALFTIAGSWTNNSATFKHNFGTLTFDSTDTGETLTQDSFSGGDTWNQRTSNAQWEGRIDYFSFSFTPPLYVASTSAMWVLGGTITGSPFRENDVWYSTDGIDWTQATAAAQWVRRTNYSAVVFAPPQYVASSTAMWVIGGSAGGTACNGLARCNDVWYSTDGIDWTQTTASAQWVSQDSHRSVVFTPPEYVASSSAMWITGGSTGSENNEVSRYIDCSCAP